MRTIILALSLLGISASLLQGTPALAQNTRSWVSHLGDDNNSCIRIAPCRTFGGALSKTNAGGSINCLDPSSFGALFINKSVEINCLNTQAGLEGLATPSFNFGIEINTAGIKVVLRGLSIEGTGSSAMGVHLTAAATVHIEKSTIRGFRAGNASGVRISNTSGIAKVHISDSHITDNGTGSTGGGIMSVPTGSGFSLVELRNVNVKENTWGVANTANSRMRISHASIAGNGLGLLNDPGSIVTLNDVDIVHNNTGISGATTSYGNNRISGQLSSDGTPPTLAGAQSHDAGQK